MWPVLRLEATAGQLVGVQRVGGGGTVGGGDLGLHHRRGGEGGAEVTRITSQGGTLVSGGAARDDVYGVLVARAQDAYLDAVDGQTDARVRSRLLLITRLLKRWQRGW